MSVNEAGEKIRRTRPFGLSAERIAHDKEVAINCGWIDGARAKRIFFGNQFSSLLL
jgi:hypothetical protein